MWYCKICGAEISKEEYDECNGCCSLCVRWLKLKGLAFIIPIIVAVVVLGTAGVVLLNESENVNLDNVLFGTSSGSASYSLNPYKVVRQEWHVTKTGEELYWIEDITIDGDNIKIIAKPLAERKKRICVPHKSKFKETCHYETVTMPNTLDVKDKEMKKISELPKMLSTLSEDYFEIELDRKNEIYTIGEHSITI